MKINLVEREFVYHGTTLADPEPQLLDRRSPFVLRRSVSRADQRSHYRT